MAYDYGSSLSGLFSNSTVIGNCSAVGSAGAYFGQRQAVNALSQALQQGGIRGVYGGPSIAQAPPTATPKQEKHPSKPKELSMFGEIARDVKSFVLEHRSVLYFLAIALIADHLLFKDAFRHRLQSIVDKIITKVEDKVS